MNRPFNTALKLFWTIVLILILCILKCHKTRNNQQCFYLLYLFCLYSSQVALWYRPHWIRLWSQVYYCVGHIWMLTAPSLWEYAILRGNYVWHIKNLMVNLYLSFYAKADNATIELIPFWQAKCNLLYLLLCWPFIPHSLMFVIFSLQNPAEVRITPPGRGMASERTTTKTCWQFRWISDYFNVISSLFKAGLGSVYMPRVKSQGIKDSNVFIFQVNKCEKNLIKSTCVAWHFSCSVAEDFSF